MANFDDLQGAVAQFGANNKVIFDDTGMPSIMEAVPKAKLQLWDLSLTVWPATVKMEQR